MQRLIRVCEYPARDRRHGGAQHGSRHGGAHAALPAGWKEGKDGNGRAYYYNSSLGKTQWRRPVTPGSGQSSGATGSSKTRARRPHHTAEGSHSASKGRHAGSGRAEGRGGAPRGPDADAAVASSESVEADPASADAAATAEAIELQLQRIAALEAVVEERKQRRHKRRSGEGGAHHASARTSGSH